MTRYEFATHSTSEISTVSRLALGFLLCTACSGSEGNGGGANVGGQLTAGGTLGTGGSTVQVSAGGTVPTGGSRTTGGSSASQSVTSGGSPASDGAPSGGAPITNVGGKSSIGGAATGGTAASAGATASGGSLGSGGAKPSGGAATGGLQGMGGSKADACVTPPEPSALVGWAAVSGNGTTSTTGGGNATPVTVSTLSELQNAAKGTSAAVIFVKGVLATGVVTVGSNKTIVGLCGAEIHGHVELSGSVNVIIRNIKIVGYAVGNCALDPAYDSSVGCSSGADAISVQNSAHHVWFDHCDISDGTDGNLDITKAADYVTVSWTKFHYTPRTDNSGNDSTGASGHRYSNLIGGSDTESSAGKLNITWHHNWWADNVYERQPQVRFGKNHLFNNLWTSSGDNYCVRAVIDAHIVLDHNVFSGIKDPHLFYTGASATSYITADATNTYANTSGSKTTGGSGAAYTPSYTYTPDATAQVQALVQSGAGPH